MTENVISLFSTPQERLDAHVRLRERQRERRARQMSAPSTPSAPMPDIGDRMTFVTGRGEHIAGTLVDIDYSSSPPVMVVRCADGVTRSGPLIPYRNEASP